MKQKDLNQKPKEIDTNIYQIDQDYYVKHDGELKTLHNFKNKTLLNTITKGAYKKYIENPGIKPNNGNQHHNNTNNSNQQKQDQMLETKNEAYDLINKNDDEQVLQELRGGFIDEYVYSFPTSQGKVTGLSWAGVKEVARQMGNISIEDLQVNEKDDSFQVKAKAKDISRNVTMFGVTEQSKKITTKTGEQIPDMHALSKCVSRAQRNAIRGLIPETFIKQMITQYQNNGGK